MFARIRISPNKGKYSAVPLSRLIKSRFIHINRVIARRSHCCYFYALYTTGGNQAL